jgi:hypothetical protein
MAACIAPTVRHGLVNPLSHPACTRCKGSSIQQPPTNHLLSRGKMGGCIKTVGALEAYGTCKTSEDEGTKTDARFTTHHSVRCTSDTSVLRCIVQQPVVLLDHQDLANRVRGRCRYAWSANTSLPALNTAMRMVVSVVHPSTPLHAVAPALITFRIHINYALCTLFHSIIDACYTLYQVAQARSYLLVRDSSMRGCKCMKRTQQSEPEQSN